MFTHCSFDATKFIIFFEHFIENYDEENNKGYIIEVDVEYSKSFLSNHCYLLFLTKRKKNQKCNELVCNINDKENYNAHIRPLKQASNHGLILKKAHRVILLNQEAWLKEYTEMNTKLKTEAKNDFEKNFLKLMSNSVFGKTMENVRQHRDIKLITTDKRRNQLV